MYQPKPFFEIAADLIETARRLNQRWVKGIALARALERTAR